MQKLVYYNQNYVVGNEQYVTFSATPPYVFEKISGVGAADTTLVSSGNSGLDGSTLYGSYVADREITVNVHIRGNTREELYENRKRLMQKLSPTLAAEGKLGRLEYTNDNGTYWIPATVKRGPQPVTRNGNYHTSVELVFYCPNPFWRSMNTIEGKMEYTGGNFFFPLTIWEKGTIDEETGEDIGGIRFGRPGYTATLENKGDAATPLEISIQGPASRPKLTKLETGEYIGLKRGIGEGETLYINTAEGNERQVSIRQADGKEEDAFGYLYLNSTFFQLEPGVNFLEYETGDDTKTARLTLAAYSRFGGV